jgi:hypothetical protein
MKGEAQARVVTEVLLHMARLQRFTVPQLARACSTNRDTVRGTVRVVEERGWVAVDGFGQRIGCQDRGAVPVAYRWLGINVRAKRPWPQESNDD